MPSRQPDLPPFLKDLYLGNSQFSNHFLDKQRLYNSLFQMTSFGSNTVNFGGWMPTLRVQGQVHHRIGSFLPLPGEDAQFLQIYFLDGSSQLSRRSSIYQGTNSTLLRIIQNYMNRHNSYVQQFKTALSVLRENAHTDLKVRLYITPLKLY
jgi:hypothetical protein